MAHVKIENETTNSAKISGVVRQGCVLSPLSFSLYSDSIFQEAVQEIEKGKKINGVWYNYNRYANDTVLLGIVLTTSSSLLTSEKDSKQMGINTNIKKTKFLIRSREPNTFRSVILTFDNLE